MPLVFILLKKCLHITYICFKCFVLFIFLATQACEILLPWPGIEPARPAFKAQSCNRWAARKILQFFFCFIPSPHLIYLKSWADTAVSENRDMGGGFRELGKRGLWPADSSWLCADMSSEGDLWYHPRGGCSSGKAVDQMFLEIKKTIKLWRKPAYDPAISFLSLYPKEIKAEKDIYTPMFITALFTTGRSWKKPRCPLTDEWTKKLWCVYIHLFLFIVE